jgi:hypothetical protein
MFNKINHLLLVIIKRYQSVFSFSPMRCSCLAGSCGRGHDILSVDVALTILFIASKERYIVIATSIVILCRWTMCHGLMAHNDYHCISTSRC